MKVKSVSMSAAGLGKMVKKDSTAEQALCNQNSVRDLELSSLGLRCDLVLALQAALVPRASADDNWAARLGSSLDYCRHTIVDEA